MQLAPGQPRSSIPVCQEGILRQLVQACTGDSQPTINYHQSKKAGLHGPDNSSLMADLYAGVDMPIEAHVIAFTGMKTHYCLAKQCPRTVRTICSADEAQSQPSGRHGLSECRVPSYYQRSADDKLQQPVSASGFQAGHCKPHEVVASTEKGDKASCRPTP